MVHTLVCVYMTRQECSICYETRTHEACEFTCTHTFCLACSNRLRTELHHLCPLCRSSRRHPLPQTGPSVNSSNELFFGLPPRSNYSAYVFFPSAQAMDVAQFIQDRERVEEEVEFIEVTEGFEGVVREGGVEGARPDPSQSPNQSRRHHSNRFARFTRPAHPNQRRTPIALTSLDSEVQVIVHGLLDPTLPISTNTTAAHPPRDWHARIPPPPPPRM